MAKKYYAVQAGRVPGVYISWDDCKAQVIGFPDAKYKGFDNRLEAEQFAQGKVLNTETQEYEKPGKVESDAVAYVDGSYFKGKYGYGVAILYNNQEIHLNGMGTDKEMASMHNVAGEICGAMTAIQWAIDNHINSITIYHDYMGISEWALGNWKTNKECTRKYYSFCLDAKSKVRISFQKVKGHSNNFYNDVVDALAKRAIGLKNGITNKIQSHIDTIASNNQN